MEMEEAGMLMLIISCSVGVVSVYSRQCTDWAVPGVTGVNTDQ